MLGRMCGGTRVDESEDWRPRGPHLPVDMPPLAWAFGIAAVWFVAASVRQFIAEMPLAGVGEWAMAAPLWIRDAAALAIPVVFLWRHPDARRTMPYLYAGVLLYGAGPLVAAAASTAFGYLADGTAIWPAQLGSVVVAAVDVVALLLIGLGLHWSREAGPAVTRRAIGGLVVLTALLGLVQVAELLGAVRTGTVEATFALAIPVVAYSVRLLVLGVLALVLVRGWRAGAQPGRAWGLAAAGAVLVALSQALVPPWYLLASFGIDLSMLWLPIPAVGIAGGVLLFAGFAAGLPRRGVRRISG
jgi:hypothetical protein